MSLDRNDPLWKLLSKAPEKRASGSFVQNTVRAARLSEEKPARAGWFGFFFGGAGLAVSGAVAAAILVIGAAIYFGNGEQTAEPEIARQVEPVPVPQDEVEVLTEELEMLNYIDSLLAVNDPSELEDEAIAEILF